MVTTLGVWVYPGEAVSVRVVTPPGKVTTLSEVKTPSGEVKTPLEEIKTPPDDGTIDATGRSVV